MQLSRRKLLFGASAAPAAALLAACGASQGTGQSAAPAALPSPTVRVAATEFPSTSYMAKIVQRGKLIAGVKQDQPLFGLLNPRTNVIEGFDVDIVTEFAPSAQKLLFAGYAECVTALQQSRVDAVSTDDIILAGFLDTDPNLKMVGG